MKKVYEVRIEYRPVFSSSVQQHFCIVDEKPSDEWMEKHVQFMKEKAKREVDGEVLYPTIQKAWVEEVYYPQ